MILSLSRIENTRDSAEPDAVRGVVTLNTAHGEDSCSRMSTTHFSKVPRSCDQCQSGISKASMKKR